MPRPNGSPFRIRYDTFSAHYFEKIDEEIARLRGRPLSMVSCNLTYLRETRLKAKDDDTHLLRHRFTQERTILPAFDLQNHMLLSAKAAFLRHELIERNHAPLRSAHFPTFQDGHFVNRYLLLNAQTKSHSRKARIYRCRRRIDDTLTHDRPTDVERYLDAFRFGYLDLLNQARRIAGHIPRFIQRTSFHDILWHIRYFLDHPELAVLTPAEQREFFDLLQQIFACIDCTTINSFDLAHCTEKLKVGLLNLMKKDRRPVTKVYLRQFDAAKGLMQFSYFSPDQDIRVIPYINDRTVPLSSILAAEAAGFWTTLTFYEHFFWLPLVLGDCLTINLEAALCDLICGSERFGAMANI